MSAAGELAKRRFEGEHMQQYAMKVSRLDSAEKSSLSFRSFIESSLSSNAENTPEVWGTVGKTPSIHPIKNVVFCFESLTR